MGLVAARDASPFVPARGSLKTLTSAVQDCKGCDLYRNATQAVFGEGPQAAAVVLIGEQPGDEEDREGAPFVGPAGRILNRALEEAGIDRGSVYVTNAVKHFKFEERGKRRIHKKPSTSEIKACRPWLQAELSLLRPKVIVCLGASAATSVFGAEYRLTKEHGKLVGHAWAQFATSTVHPSAILRTPDRDARHLAYQEFVADLKKVAQALA